MLTRKTHPWLRNFLIKEAKRLLQHYLPNSDFPHGSYSMIPSILVPLLTALDERVLMAMAKVPRHEFVPVEVQSYAYLNRPIPIGFDKTISQPLMIAVMTDLLELKADDMVLEIGTGLGYQSAVLAELAGKVYSVEIIDELAQRAKQRLNRRGYTNVEVRIGNGYTGWPNHAPFDKVMVTAAPDLIPPP